jgi:hypothetical protein
VQLKLKDGQLKENGMVIEIANYGKAMSGFKRELYLRFHPFFVQASGCITYKLTEYVYELYTHGDKIHQGRFCSWRIEERMDTWIGQLTIVIINSVN